MAFLCNSRWRLDLGEEAELSKCLEASKDWKICWGFGQKDHASIKSQDTAVSRSCWLMHAVSGVVMGL